MPDRFVTVARAAGRPGAELLRSYLRAQGIPCELSQEPAAWVQGFTVGPMAEVEIRVPSRRRKEASDLIAGFRRREPTSRD